MTSRKRVAILISGRGSNMRSLVEAARAPGYPAEIVTVISNRPKAAGLKWAKEQGLPALAIDHTQFESRQLFEHAIHAELEAARVDIVCLAGFMRLMTAEFVDKWRNRMINIHPSLLPAFKGLKTHERALAAGVKVSGCTVHLVRAEMDDGPILAQAAVPVLSGDTADSLAARILDAEHRLYPHALSLFVSNQFKVDGDIVKIVNEINQPQALFSPPLLSADTGAILDNPGG